MSPKPWVPVSVSGADPGFLKKGGGVPRKGGGGPGEGPIWGAMLKIMGQKGGPDPLDPPI